MADIIHRLRDGAIQARLAMVEGFTPEGIGLMGEAADEIERLQVILQKISNGDTDDPSAIAYEALKL